MTDNPHDRRARIAAAFGGAADYDEAARIQQAAAGTLAAAIGASRLPAEPRIIELGCGTGFLTRAIADAVGTARWTISDIAPAMVERARRQLDIAGADYRVIDGEAVDPALGTFDLIASNMAFQWFADLQGAVGRLVDRLAPGGLLAFSTMAQGSFAEWTRALADEGLPSGTPSYPDQAALAALVPAGVSASIEIVDFPQEQPDARAFLRRLKTIGAAVPAAGYSPLTGTALRRAMMRFDAGPRIVTYRLGFCLLRAA